MKSHYTPLSGIALFGCGYWGRKLLRVIRAVRPDLRLTVWDTREQAMRDVLRGMPGITPASGADEVWNDRSVGAVFIATPAATHTGYVSRAISHRKHAFVEKPMAMSSIEARALGRSAATRGLAIAVDHTFLFDPAIRKMKDLIVRGHAGDVWFLESDRSHFGTWRDNESVIWDLGIHDVVIAEYLFGCSSSRVRAGVPNGPARPAVAHIELRYPDGKTAYVRNSWMSPDRTRRLSVTGANGTVTYSDAGGSRSLIFRRTSVRFHSPKHPVMKDGGTTEIPFGGEEPLSLSVADFFRSAEYGQTPHVPPSAAIPAIRTLEALSKSAAKNGAWQTTGL